MFGDKHQFLNRKKAERKPSQKENPRKEKPNNTSRATDNESLRNKTHKLCREACAMYGSMLRLQRASDETRRKFQISFIVVAKMNPSLSHIYAHVGIAYAISPPSAQKQECAQRPVACTRFHHHGRKAGRIEAIMLPQNKNVERKKCETKNVYLHLVRLHTKSRVQSMNNKLRGSEQYNSVRQLLSIPFAFNIAMHTAQRAHRVHRGRARARARARAIRCTCIELHLLSQDLAMKKKIETKICCVQVERLKRIGICSHWMSSVRLPSAHKCIWHRAPHRMGEKWIIYSDRWANERIFHTFFFSRLLSFVFCHYIVAATAVAVAAASIYSIWNKNENIYHFHSNFAQIKCTECGAAE